MITRLAIGMVVRCVPGPLMHPNDSEQCIRHGAERCKGHILLEANNNGWLLTKAYNEDETGMWRANWWLWESGLEPMSFLPPGVTEDRHSVRES